MRPDDDDRLALPARVHVLGAGGIGLSAVAILLAERGIPVTGSDLRDSPLVDQVRRAGATVRLQPWPDAAADADWLVVPHGVGNDHPEVAAAHGAGTEVLSRDQALARLLANTPTLAVVGTLTRSATALMLAERLGGIDADIGYAVGAFPDREAMAHVRAGTARFVVELDERYDIPTLDALEGIVVADLADPPHGIYGPRATDDVRAALLAAAAHAGAWCIVPDPLREDDIVLAWQRIEPDGTLSRRLIARTISRGWQGCSADVDVVGHEPDGSATRLSLHLDLPPGRLAAQAHLASLAGALLAGASPTTATLATRTELPGVTGQLHRHAGTRANVLHDVRTWPVAIEAIATDIWRIEAGDDAEGTPRPAIVTRPYAFTMNHSRREDLVVAHRKARVVIVLPPYPGGQGDEAERLADWLEHDGIDVRRARDDDHALELAAACHGDAPGAWLCLGGDDMGELARRLRDHLEPP